MCHNNYDCQRQRTCRGGRRKQKHIHTITGHRPMRIQQARPPTTLTHIPTHNVSDTDKNKNNECTHGIIPSHIGHRPTRFQHARRPPSSIRIIARADIPQNSDSIARSTSKNSSMNQQSKHSENSLPKHHLKVTLLNSRSVGNKTTILEDYIIDNDLDIFIITESWLLDQGDDSILALLIPSGYKYVWQNRKTESHNRGGGILIIFKEQLNIIKIDTDLKQSFEHLEFTINYKNNFYRFIVVYRPDQRKKKIYINDFIDEFCDYVIDRSTEPGKLIITGDFNIHVDDQADKDSMKLMKLLQSLNLVQLVSEPTHISGHTLDLLIRHTTDESVTSLNVEKPILSDHSCVDFTLSIHKPKPLKKKMKYRKTKDIDIDAFKKSIIDSKMDEQIKSLSDVNDQTDIFNKELGRILEIHAPLKQGCIVIRPNCQWYNSEIRTAKTLLRGAERKHKKSKKPEDRKRYKEMRNKMNKMLTSAKRKHIKDNIFQNKGNTKELFKLTSNLLKPCQTNCVDSSIDKCESFNNFFIEKISKIREEFKHPDNSRYSNNYNTCDKNVSKPCGTVLNELDLPSELEIADIIKKMPPKTCALDPIPTWLLKACCDNLTSPIKTIVDTSISTGIFPTALKHATVTPLLKKPSLDKDQLKNYRPVSNIPVLSKIIEKIVSRRLNSHLLENNLSTKLQSAYKTHHSTETSLLRVHNDIVRFIDHKSCVALVLLDLSAAFDTIDHKILLSRLASRFNIHGTALKWFDTYLHQRTQSVTIDAYSSQPAALHQGVPQGSILGPILFTLYTSPLSDVIESHNINYHLYADDTQLYIPLNGNTDTKNLQNCTADIQAWMNNNMLKLNSDKTDIILLGTDKRVNKINLSNIEICDSHIKIADHVKDLGFILNSNLSMNHHITKTCQTSLFTLRNIRRIRPLIDEDTTKLLINSLITSRLDYCNSLLYGIPDYEIKKLQKIQNHAAKLIMNKKKYDHVTETMKYLHWLPISYRIEFKILSIVYKCLNDQAPLYLSELLVPYVPPRTLRSSDSNLLSIPRTYSRFGERAFSICAPQLWNMLGENCKQSASLSSFKKSLKTHLFRQAYSNHV